MKQKETILYSLITQNKFTSEFYISEVINSIGKEIPTLLKNKIFSLYLELSVLGSLGVLLDPQSEKEDWDSGTYDFLPTNESEALYDLLPQGISLQDLIDLKKDLLFLYEKERFLAHLKLDGPKDLPFLNINEIVNLFDEEMISLKKCESHFYIVLKREEFTSHEVAFIHQSIVEKLDEMNLLHTSAYYNRGLRLSVLKIKDKFNSQKKTMLKNKLSKIN